jgi:hypothetical protein
LELSAVYAGAYTGGAKIARVHIRDENYYSQHLALHRLHEQTPGVIVYYVDKDFNANDGAVPLKAGWNFWDENAGIISQNINDFFDKGYKWQFETWD